MNKKAIITGAAGNLGSATVDIFLRAGFHVIATVEPGTRHHFSAHAPNLEVHEVDVTQEESTRIFVQNIFSVHHTIDVAVLLVGGFTMGNIAETDTQELQRMIRLNFESAYCVTRPTFLRMQWQETGGHLIFIGARPALDSNAGKDMIAYGLSKSLLFQFAEMLNAGGKEKNVYTTVVVPSIIDTPANRAAMPQADFSTWVRPEELAEEMLAICSNSTTVPEDRVVKVYGRA
jgi:NAD(P)-dependent dehydrogenase (short-subunit alcohol dehydrogenase family)